jgi:hypothetical protein
VVSVTDPYGRNLGFLDWTVPTPTEIYCSFYFYKVQLFFVLTVDIPMIS